MPILKKRYLRLFQWSLRQLLTPSITLLVSAREIASSAILLAGASGSSMAMSMPERPEMRASHAWGRTFLL